MSSLKYIPLHVHSDASLDGAGTVASLVARAKQLGFPALALTDHGTLANAVAFWSACTEADIKPILGMEAYLSYQGRRHHLTLLSLSEQGFNNLIEVDSEAHSKGYDAGYPMVTMDNLNRHHQELLALTGCVSSALYTGSEADADTFYQELVDVFEKENVLFEQMFVGSTDTWSRPMAMAKRWGAQRVITNDTHYPCQEQFHAHQTICKARRGFTYNSEHLWLKTGDEISREAEKKGLNLVEITAAFNNTLSVANRVVDWNMKVAPSLPHIGVDVEFALQTQLRIHLKFDVDRKGGKNERLARLRTEFRMLKAKGFLDYIYILWDIVQWAKKRGIEVGPGRGSGGGSYLLYLLGITRVDPLEYGLMFERFINAERADYPDVDVDFEADRRGEVLNYAKDRWGAIPIATFNCYSHKSAVHDIARELAIPKDLEIPAAEGAVDSEAFSEFCAANAAAYSTYQTMLGQIRHRGKHAAGVIIPNRPVPIEHSGDELVAAWAEGMNTKDLSKIGIVKYDLLSLTALSQLKEMREITGYSPPERYDDPAIFALFCAGDVSGIFQWTGSEGIRELTMRVAPSNFFDLITCNALYRPGALDAGTAEHYPEFMKKPRLLEPTIDKLLAQTYGVICYQEQVMAVVSQVMGGGLAQADLVRRLISKSDIGNPKWDTQIEELHQDFMAKGSANGFSSTVLAHLWGEVYTHSRYSYNLSHATTYTMISYQMAWYKHYHRAAFTIAVLHYDTVNAQSHILDAIEHDMEIRMPHVNHSLGNHAMAWSQLSLRNQIFLPLTDIAFLGERSAVFIIQERLVHGDYLSYEDFAKRVPAKVCNNRTRQMMERIGAFDGLPGDPTSAIKEYNTIPVNDKYENQLEILGYVVPERLTYQKMRALADKPAKKGYLRFTGFIQKITRKESSHGVYVVYTLSPSGSFWVRGELSSRLKVGKFVSGTKSKFGHSNDVVVYRLGA